MSLQCIMFFHTFLKIAHSNSRPSVSMSFHQTFSQSLPALLHFTRTIFRQVVAVSSVSPLIRADGCLPYFAVGKQLFHVYKNAQQLMLVHVMLRSQTLNDDDIRRNKLGINDVSTERLLTRILLIQLVDGR